MRSKTLPPLIKTVSMIKTPGGVDRNNGDLALFYWAYHHDMANGKAASMAQVRVYNIVATGLN